jgi:hypothetical protein
MLHPLFHSGLWDSSVTPGGLVHLLVSGSDPGMHTLELQLCPKGFPRMFVE